MLEPGCAGLLGLGVEEVQQVFGVRVRLGHDGEHPLAHIRGTRRHARPAAARNDDLAHEVGPAQSDVLRHDATE